LFFVANLLQHLPRALRLSLWAGYLSATLNLLWPTCTFTLSRKTQRILFPSYFSFGFFIIFAFRPNCRLYLQHGNACAQFSHFPVTHFAFPFQCTSATAAAAASLDKRGKRFEISMLTRMTFAIFRTLCILLNCLSHGADNNQENENENENFKSDPRDRIPNPGPSILIYRES